MNNRKNTEKMASMICPEIHYRKISSGIMITGCYGWDGMVVLPDEIEDKPVTAWRLIHLPVTGRMKAKRYGTIRK
ncbi:MAG: hypothetical protein V8R43_01585 [Dorea sp.]